MSNSNVQQVHVQQQPFQPSVWQKLGMGAMMGGGVGLTIGFIGGMLQIMRAGPGPRGAMATLSQFMGTSAATFGFFMSIGSVIRNESELPDNVERQWASAGRIAPIVMARRMQAQQQEQAKQDHN